MNMIAGSWFKVEGHVRARDDEDARAIMAVIREALSDRPTEGLVVFFDAPRSDDYSDEIDTP